MSDGVDIRLDLRQPARQRIAVRQSWLPTTLLQRFRLPKWTPGSYTIRDHVQHLHGLACRCGDRDLPVQRMDPSNWQVDLPELAPVSLSYVVEARDLTVRTCHLDPAFASLCMAAVAMNVEECRWSPHHLTIEAPETWNVHVPLPVERGGWLAADFDALVDSPVHAGPFDAMSFEVENCPHDLVLIGTPPGGWPNTLADDIAAVCSATCRLMGTPPPAGDRYQLIIQMLDQGYGGLEHDHSAVLQFSWRALSEPGGYRQLLQLVGHEYLHQWNVRRLRPAEYRPYDYDRAVISEGLWFAEGITSYFDLTTTLLAGCSDRAALLVDLGGELSRVLMTPGRSIQSLASSAREAWVKLYKATSASVDSQISYYRLGAAVAFCLDVRLRQVGSSLSSVLRGLWESHGRVGRGYTRRDIQLALQQHDPDLSADLERWLDQPDLLPLEAATTALGMRLSSVAAKRPRHGLTLAEEAGQIVVKRVASDGPAAEADLVVGDELIAVDRRRLCHRDDLARFLTSGVTAVITLSRRGELCETALIPDEGVDCWRLDWESGATAAQLALRERWFQIL